MKKRQYKTNVDILLTEGRRIVNTTSDPVFKHRCTLVNMVLSGTPATEIAKSSKEKHSTISRWVRIADIEGFEALRPKPGHGRKPRLTAEQEIQIGLAVEVDTPTEYGYLVWDGPTVSKFIYQQYGVTLGVRQCQRLLHKLDFALIRPQPYPSKGEENSEARQEFKKKSLR